MQQTLRPTDDLIVKTRLELHDLSAAYNQLQKENERLVRETGYMAVENIHLREALRQIGEITRGSLGPVCQEIAEIVRHILEGD